MVSQSIVKETAMQARVSSLLEVDEPHQLRTGELVVDAGIVWLTESGHSADLFLRKGQRYRCNGARKPIIQSLAAGTRVTFHPGLPSVREAIVALGSAVAGLFRHRLHMGSRGNGVGLLRG
jgi:hypothetical protein